MLLMSHFTALLERVGGLALLISCFSDSSPFFHLCCVFISSSSAFFGARMHVYFLSHLSPSPSFLFTELVQLIHMQPSRRNKGGILDSLQSYGKYQGHVCTGRPKRKTSGCCLQLQCATCSSNLLSEEAAAKPNCALLKKKKVLPYISNNFIYLHFYTYVQFTQWQLPFNIKAQTTAKLEQQSRVAVL